MTFEEFHDAVVQLCTPVDPKAWMCNVLTVSGLGELRKSHNHLTVRVRGHSETFIGSDEDVLHELREWLRAPSCDTPEYRCEVAQAMGVA